MSSDQTSSLTRLGAVTGAAAICAVAFGEAPGANAIIVRASTPEMAVPMRTSDRQPVVIESLDFEFDIETRCAPGGAPASVMLSVADTRRQLTDGELEANQKTTVVLRVPARQIAPLNVQGFCTEDNQAALASSMTVSGILSVQASLVCADDTGESISYTSTSLDLSLACAEPAVAE